MLHLEEGQMDVQKIFIKKLSIFFKSEPVYLSNTYIFILAEDIPDKFFFLMFFLCWFKKKKKNSLLVRKNYIYFQLRTKDIFYQVTMEVGSGKKFKGVTYTSSIFGWNILFIKPVNRKDQYIKIYRSYAF